ncbi:MAG: hypothetical protein V9G24_05365 [Rhodoblastus sp.]
MIAALDIDAQSLSAPLAQHFAIERVIAVERRDIFEAHVLVADRRQRADHHEIGVEPMRDGVAARPKAREIAERARQNAARKLERLAIQFDVEAREFRHDERIVERVEHLSVDRRGEVIVIENPCLDLEAEHGVFMRETVLREQVAQQARFLRETRGEQRLVLARKSLSLDFLAHRRPVDARSLARPARRRMTGVNTPAASPSSAGAARRAGAD